MQATFGTILLALVNGVPRVMGLREILFHFVDHRHDVVVRRSQFRVDKGKGSREHILEGLKIAVDNIDEVIAIIRSSPDTATALARLRAEAIPCGSRKSWLGGPTRLRTRMHACWRKSPRLFPHAYI